MANLPEDPGATAKAPIIIVWVLLGGLASALLVRATFASPPGTVFVGTLYYVDDFYNYLSYVQQAEDGALVFRNKLRSPTPLPRPSLVNLEWLLVGWLSVLLGGRPILAFHLVGLVALAWLVYEVDRWMVRAGLSPPRRLAALLFVFTGGGLGWVVVLLGRHTTLRPFDVTAGVFPFLEVIANPHFVVGTALLVAALNAFAENRPALGIVLGNALALARPYDAGLLLGATALAVLILVPRRQWLRRLLLLLGLTPSLIYDAWVFLWSPGFSVFSSPAYAVPGPSILELAIVIGPATLAALTALVTWRDASHQQREHRLLFALWAVLALLLVYLQPVSFSLQFFAGVGVALLSLGAVGLGQLRRGVLETAVPLFAGTAVLVTSLQLRPNTYRNVTAERWRVAVALRGLCAPGELVVAPADIGLYVGGLSSCWPWVSHATAPDFAAHDEAVDRFYHGTPEERRVFADRVCAKYVVVPLAWPRGGFPAGAPYHLKAQVGRGKRAIAVYSRNAGAPCPP